jgi:hypothetical protein
LWLVTLCGVVWANVTDIPHHWPDFVRGFLPLFSFKLWWLIQKDLIGRFDRIRSLFTPVAQTEIGVRLANLAKGLRRGEPLYPGYIAAEVLIHAAVVVSVLDASIPWLYGQSSHANFFLALGALVSGTTSLAPGYASLSQLVHFPAVRVFEQSDDGLAAVL